MGETLEKRNKEFKKKKMLLRAPDSKARVPRFLIIMYLLLYISKSHTSSLLQFFPIVKMNMRTIFTHYYYFVD